MQKRRIRVYYYVLECTKKDERGKIISRNFDVDVFLKNIDEIPLAERVIKNQDDYARLEYFFYPKGNENSMVALVFNRMSDFNTLRKSKFDEFSESIPLEENEYIDKTCSVVYDFKLNLLAMQNNLGAITARGIEQYLAQKYKGGEYEFRLIPVVSPGAVEAIKKQRLFRGFSFTLKGIGSNTKLAEGTESELLIDSFRNSQKMGSPTTKIEYSMGNKRKDNLNIEFLLKLIPDLQRNKDLVDKAEFYIRKNESDDGETTILNLFQAHLSDFIELEVVPRQPVSPKEVIKKVIDKVKKKEDYIRSLREK